MDRFAQEEQIEERQGDLREHPHVRHQLGRPPAFHEENEADVDRVGTLEQK